MKVDNVFPTATGKVRLKYSAGLRVYAYEISKQSNGIDRTRPFRRRRRRRRYLIGKHKRRLSSVRKTEVRVHFRVYENCTDRLVFDYVPVRRKIQLAFDDERALKNVK